MIRETNAPKSYIHKTEYEKTLNVAKLHKGKPIRRITHTNDIYGKIKPIHHRTVGGRGERNAIDRINRLMAWMHDQGRQVTLSEMEEFLGCALHAKNSKSDRAECCITWLLKNGYIQRELLPTRGRKALYTAIKDGY